METARPALRVIILHCEISLSSQCLDHIVNNRTRFLLVALSGDGGLGRRVLAVQAGHTQANDCENSHGINISLDAEESRVAASLKLTLPVPRRHSRSKFHR